MLNRKINPCACRRINEKFLFTYKKENAALQEVERVECNFEVLEYPYTKKKANMEKPAANPGSKIVRCLNCSRAMLLKNCYIEMNINFHLEKQDQHYSVTAFPKIVGKFLGEDIFNFKDTIDELTEKLLELENADFELSQNNKLVINIKNHSASSQ